MIGDESTTVVVADEHGVGAVAPAAQGRPGRTVGRVEERDERRTVDGQHGVHRHQALGDDVGSPGRVVGPRRGVLDRHRHLQVRRAVRRGRRGHPDHALHGEPLTNEATGQCAVRSVDRLGLGSALEVERQLVGGGAVRRDDEGRQVHHAVDRLVPLDVGDPVHLEGVDGSERGPGGGEGLSGQQRFDPAPLGLQAPDAHLQDRVDASVARVERGTRSGPTSAPTRPPRSRPAA